MQLKHLRPARPDEVEKVTAFQRAAYERNRGILGVEPIPLKADYKKILSEYEVWLHEERDELAGILILEPRPDDLLIWSVATAPDARHGGIGNLLLAAAEARARELGKRVMRLYTGDRLLDNIAWYQRRGYAIERTEAMNDRRIVHMLKRLEESELAGRLKGKTAFLTAAGAGIGRETAELFVAEGAKVIATDLDKSKLAGLDGDCRALDVRSTDAVSAMARDIGAVDILFNCAGYVHHGTVLDCSDEDWDFSFDLNVKSMHRTIKAFLPAMLEKGGGSIVNISSGVSSIRGVPNRYVYGATKAAVIGLTKAVAADFIRRGVRCNAICPGTIQSPSLDDRIAKLAKSSGQSLESVRKAFIDRQPIGRLGTAREMANLALYLASDESSYTTGQIHIADGGFAL